jgi:glucose/arabinose dehydrogenase/PKD repeat protein
MLAKALAALIAVAGSLLLFARDGAPAGATLLPPGFEEVVVADGLNLPMDFEFAPDGSTFVAEKSGVVRVIENGVVNPNPVLDISDHVNERHDRGLYNIALDPNFSTNGYFYLIYGYDLNPANEAGPKTGRVSRFTLVGDVAAPESELVILGTAEVESCLELPIGADCIPAHSPAHQPDELHFAPDGTLFVSLGDADLWGTEQILLAQNPDYLGGKILHINTDGTGVANNPFWNGDPNANRSKVWALGFRNPFRMTLQNESGLLFVGDVGQSNWEEINVVVPGGNYGWPCYEGSDHYLGYELHPICQSLYALGPGAVVAPLHKYPGTLYGSCVVGGDFATGYPPPYQGAFFFGDCNFARISYLTLGEDGAVSSVQLFATQVGVPVSFKRGPGGEIYYLELFSGQLRHIHYQTGNRAPSAVAAADPFGGLAPLQVNFSSSGSSDPDTDVLSYLWDFGDGSALSSEASPAHTYVIDGSYTATLTVSDGEGGQDIAEVLIVVGNEPPTATILSPANGSPYLAGDALAYEGSGFDPELGDLDGVALEWTIILHHNIHIHPYDHHSGSGGEIDANDHGDNTWFEIVLTVTDAVGLQDTDRVFVYPQTEDLTLDTTPSGLTVIYDDRALRAPATVRSVANSLRTIRSPSPQFDGSTVSVFDSWSDGGDVQHVIDTGLSDSTLTATHHLTAGPDDTDGDGIPDVDEIALYGSNPLSADSDRDGCLDGREVGPVAALGGQRDPTNRWDFFDTPNAAGEFDKAITMLDITRIVRRYGASEWVYNRLDDPRSVPPPAPQYHPAFDRSSPGAGNPVWALRPPDGRITVVELRGVITQYGHRCS